MRQRSGLGMRGIMKATKRFVYVCDFFSLSLSGPLVYQTKYFLAYELSTIVSRMMSSVFLENISYISSMKPHI